MRIGRKRLRQIDEARHVGWRQDILLALGFRRLDVRRIERSEVTTPAGQSGVHAVGNAVDVGVLHSEHQRSIAPHGVPGDPAAARGRKGAVLVIDERDELLGREVFPTAGRD